ncbi:MAG: zinc-binding dehydrogenase [Candidatus Poribacteria bacterium]
MPDKMKAALLYGVKDVRVEQTDTPPMDEAKVLIKIKYCGVCPSDVRWYTGARSASSYPRRLGHEWVGEVVQIGAEVEEDFKIGDRVAPDWRVVCGKCHYCRRGIFNYCEDFGYGKVSGGFCEYGTAISPNLRLIPEGVSYPEATFTEPLACCINGINKNNIKIGDDVVIVGTGPIGLMHVQLAKHLGGRVIACDLVEERLEVAKQVGADEVICAAREEAIEKVKELTDGRGANSIVVAVGAPNAIEMALQMAGICGTVNLFAGTYPPAKIDLDPNLIHYKQLLVTGSHDFTPHDFTSALKLIECGAVKVKPIISHVLPLERIKEGFDTVVEKKGLKVVIKIADK